MLDNVSHKVSNKASSNMDWQTFSFEYRLDGPRLATLLIEIEAGRPSRTFCCPRIGGTSSTD